MAKSTQRNKLVINYLDIIEHEIKDAYPDLPIQVLKRLIKNCLKRYIAVLSEGSEICLSPGSDTTNHTHLTYEDTYLSIQHDRRKQNANKVLGLKNLLKRRMKK